MNNSFAILYPLGLIAMWFFGFVLLLYVGVQVLRLLVKLNVYVQLLIDKEQDDFE